jgi:hypothetical protein
MEAAFQDDVSKSQLITKDAWAKRPMKDRVLETSARVWQYWL